MKITRTVKRYEYQFGTVDNMTVKPVTVVQSYDKLGPRSLAKVKAENNIPENAICYNVQEIEEYRGMDMETFIANSEIIEKPSKEESDG